MDQVKVILAWIKEHHFWLLSVLAVGLTLGGWSVGQSRLAAETDKNKQAIKSDFDKVSRIRNMPFHPNDNVNQAQAAETRKLSAKVRQEWQRLYQVQVNEVLKWPPQLGQDFANQIAKLSFGEDIPLHLRNEYLNYIQGRFPDLPKIIDAAVSTGSTQAGGRGGGRTGGFGLEFTPATGGGRGGDQPEDDHMVVWHDQDRIRDQLDWQNKPSSLAIWVTQEDLWVYETLLKAIAATNQAARADRYSNAAVRDIYNLEVGAAVAKESASDSRIFIPEDTSSAIGGRRGGMMRGGGEAPMMRGGMSGGGRGGGGETDGAASLLAGRYYDNDGKPLPPPAGDNMSFGTEYKQLPVRMVLKLDQRYLQHLLTELANAPLQVEIQEVRINPAGGAGGSGRGGSTSFGARGSDAGTLAFDREPYVRDQVVLNGLVYIFYPPNDELLAVPTDDAGLAAN